MNDTPASSRLLLSSGIAIVLALGSYASLAALMRHQRLLLVVGDVVLFFVFVFLAVVRQRYLPSNRWLWHSTSWLLVGTFTLPIFYILGQTLWVLINGLLITTLGVPFQATIISRQQDRISDRQVECWSERNCTQSMVYQFIVPQPHDLPRTVIVEQDVTFALFRQVRAQSIVTIHAVPAIPSIADIDGNRTDEVVLGAVMGVLIFGSILTLGISFCFIPQPGPDAGQLPAEAIYQRYKWFIEALNRRQPPPR